MPALGLSQVAAKQTAQASFRLKKGKGVPQVDYVPSWPSVRRGIPFDEIQEARK
jgi:hypothetical protein